MGILDSILGGAGGANPTSAITDLIGSHEGGLGGLLKSFDKGGMGEAAQSWVGKGRNLPISAAQIESVLGAGPLGDMAKKLGIDPHTAAGQISEFLPQVIDKLTPDGKVEAGPLGALGGLLGGLTK